MCAYLCVLVSMSVYMHACIHIHKHTHIHKHERVLSYARMHACLYMCVVCTRSSACLHTHTHTDTRMLARVCAMRALLLYPAELHLPAQYRCVCVCGIHIHTHVVYMYMCCISAWQITRRMQMCFHTTTIKHAQVNTQHSQRVLQLSPCP